MRFFVRLNVSWLLWTNAILLQSCLLLGYMGPTLSPWKQPWADCSQTTLCPSWVSVAETMGKWQQLADNAPHECIWKESAKETVEAWHHPSLLHLLFFHLPLCHQTLNFPTLSSWVSVFSNSQTQHQVPAPTSPPLPSTLSLLEPDHVSPTPTTQIWSDQKSNAENAQAQTEVVSESTLNHGILMSYHCCVTPPHVLHTEIVSCEAVRSGMFRCWVSVITDAAS